MYLQHPTATFPHSLSLIPSLRMIHCVIAVSGVIMVPLRARAACEGDSDCKYGRQCLQGVCTPEQACTNDKQCPGNLVCTNAHCMTPEASQQPTSPEAPQATQPSSPPAAPQPQAAQASPAPPETSPAPPAIRLVPEVIRISPEEHAAAMLKLRLRDPVIASAARESLSSVTGYQVGGWILLAIGQLTNLSALGNLLANGGSVNAPASLSLVSTIAFSIGAPVASGGGSAARDGLDLLGLEQDGHGLRSTGWVFYGISLGLNSLAAVFDIVALSNQDTGDTITGVALGITAGALGLVSVILLEADAAEARHQLARALATGTQPSPQAATNAVVDRQFAANARPAAQGAGYGFSF